MLPVQPPPLPLLPLHLLRAGGGGRDGVRVLGSAAGAVGLAGAGVPATEGMGRLYLVYGRSGELLLLNLQLVFTKHY